MPANFPKNPAENAYPEILGGDQAKQIEAVTQYLMTLGTGAATARRSACARDHGRPGHLRRRAGPLAVGGPLDEDGGAEGPAPGLRARRGPGGPGS